MKAPNENPTTHTLVLDVLLKSNQSKAHAESVISPMPSSPE